jgi:hypothetical protein
VSSADEFSRGIKIWEYMKMLAGLVLALLEKRCGAPIRLNNSLSRRKIKFGRGAVDKR